jgi:hypothetical protein
MMAQDLSRLKTSLSLAQARLRGLDQMIRDRHLWGSRVDAARKERAELIDKCDRMIERIAQVEAFNRAPRVRLHS